MEQPAFCVWTGAGWRMTMWRLKYDKLPNCLGDGGLRRFVTTPPFLSQTRHIACLKLPLSKFNCLKTGKAYT